MLSVSLNNGVKPFMKTTLPIGWHRLTGWEMAWAGDGGEQLPSE